MDALSAETIICRMSLALHECPDLSIRDSRRWAYRKHEISEGHIRQFDADAVRYEEIRRRLWPHKTRTIGGIVARLTAACLAVAAFHLLWDATPAWAASPTAATATDWGSSFLTALKIIAGLIGLGAFVYFIVSYLMYPNVTDWEGLEYRDDRDALARDREQGVL